MKQYEDHPLASILPMMSQMEIKELAADIQQNGLRAPITLLDDQILDGRNRYKACQMVGVEPKFRQFNGDGDPVAFIVSANVKRRHLTTGQRAMVAAKIARLPRGVDRTQGKTTEEAAKEVDVSPRSVETAKQVLRDAPEEVEAVERGEKTLNEAAKKVKAKQPKENLDKTGYAIPESILFDWERASETGKDLLRQISGVRSEVKNALTEKDSIFAEVSNTTIADLDNAYTSIKCIVPYAVCTSCQGHNRKKCNLCKGRGFISEFAYRSYVPKEIKELRGKK